MKRKTALTKAAAVILSAAMVVSGSGITTLAETIPAQTEAEETADPQTAENTQDAGEEVAPESGSGADAAEKAEDAGEAIKEEAEEAAETTGTEGTEAAKNADDDKETDGSEKATDEEQKNASDADANAEETNAEAAQESAAEEALSAEASEEGNAANTAGEEVLTSETRSPNPNDYMSVYMPDSTLLQAVTNLYNAKMNNGNPITSDYLTVGDMESLTEVRLVAGNSALGSVKLADVSSVEGLGYAVNATVIDLSGLTNVTTIPEQEFKALTKLQTIILRDETTGMGKAAFQDCTALKYINVRKGTELLQNTLPSSLVDTSTQSNLFANCTSLTDITLPNLKNGAALQNATGLFKGCTSLANITISPNVEVLPASCFEWQCDPQKNPVVTLNVEIQNGSKLQTIGGDCFRYSNLRTIDLRNSKMITLIDEGAFCADKSKVWNKKEVCKVPLEEMRLPRPEEKMPTGEAGYLSIGKDAFYRSALKSLYVTDEPDDCIYLPDYIEKLGEGAFYQDSTTVDVSARLSNNLKVINYCVFDGFSHLTAVTCDETIKVTEICDNAFADTGITDASFVGNMNGLVTFGKHKYNIPMTALMNTLVSTNTEAKFNSDATQAYIHSVAPTKSNVPLRGEVFGKALKTITFPKSLRKITSCALADRVNLETVKWVQDDDIVAGQEYEIGDAAFAFCLKLKSFELPTIAEGKDTELRIGDAAFDTCQELTTVKARTKTGNGSVATENNKLPISLTYLGGMAFSTCSALPSMRINDRPDNTCPTLNARTFEFCHSMTSASLPSTLTVIPEKFYYDALLTGSVPGNPAAVTEIGAGAFFGNQFYSAIDLSEWNKLEKIGALAFAYFDPGSSAYEAYVTKQNSYEALATKLPNAVILPIAVDDMIWGEGAFRSNPYLDTISTMNSNTAKGTAFIPLYVLNKNCGPGVFAETAISKAEWEYTKVSHTAEQEWMSIPSSMFMGCDNITYIKDCLPSGDYLRKVTTLGSGTFAFCYGLGSDPSHTSIDLRSQEGFVALQSTGTKCFSNCIHVQKVFLPDNGIYTSVSDEMFQVGNNSMNISAGNGYYSFLKEIDFGKVTTIGKYAFACCNSVKVGNVNVTYAEQGYPWPSSLKELTIPKQIEVIDSNAFQGRIGINHSELPDEVVELLMSGTESVFPGLQTLKFEQGAGNELTIGAGAFATNYELVMTKDTPLPDRLTTIGASAFMDCANLGDVVVGSGLRSIGEGAFKQTISLESDKYSARKEKTTKLNENKHGLKSVDLSKAKNLTTIGREAFRESALERIDLEVTPLVDTLNSYVFTESPYLHSIKLGKNMGMIQTDSMNACPALEELSVYSTSTIHKNAFNTKSTKHNRELITNLGSGFAIKVIRETYTVALDNEMAFPFNLSLYDKGDPSSMPMHVGEENGEDFTQFFKVSAKENYYHNKIVAGNQIKDPAYYEQLSEDASHRKINNDVNRDVCTFKIKGLKETAPGVSIPFVIQTTLRLNSQNVAKNVRFSASFDLVVKKVSYYPELLKVSADGKSTEVLDKISNPTVYDVGASNQSMVLAYKINASEANTTAIPDPEDAKLIITTSDVNIIGISGQGGAYPKAADGKTNDTTQYIMTSVPNATTAEDIVRNKKFTITFKKCGTATVSAYLSGYPDKKITWTFNVFADISNINLGLPREMATKGGFEAGDQFSILNSVTLYKQGSLSRNQGTLADLPKYSHASINYVSSDPSIVTVDSNGIVTIKNATKEYKEVTINATAKNVNTGGNPIAARPLVLKIGYPTLTKNKVAEPKNMGGTIRVLTPPDESGKGCTAVFDKASAGAETVTVPGTMDLYGVKVKITGINRNAFTKNTTVKKVIIGAGINELPDSCFAGCTALQTVTVQGKLKAIPRSCFDGCKSLTSFTIPATVTAINDAAFQGCAKLKKIVIPKKVKTIGRAAFSGCSKLANVTFKTKSALLTIGDQAFMGCKSLKKMTIPSAKLTSIGISCFEKDKKLKTLTLKSKKITYVGMNAFKGINKKAVIKVPKGKAGAYKALFAGKGQGSKVKIK